MMLAQITNQVAPRLQDPTGPFAIGWFFIIGVCVVVGVNAVIDLWRKVTKPEGPERRDVTISPGVASEKALTDHQVWDSREHEKLWSKIGGVERGATEKMTNELGALRNERHTDAQVLQQKLDKFHLSIGGLEKATELQNQQLAQIQAALVKGHRDK